MAEPAAELLAAGRAEVTGYGVEIVDDQVLTIESGFVVRTAGGRVLTARRVLVATGVGDELPDIPGVRRRWGKDLLHYPYCHGWEVLNSAEQAELEARGIDIVRGEVARLIIEDDLAGLPTPGRCERRDLGEAFTDPTSGCNRRWYDGGVALILGDTSAARTSAAIADRAEMYDFNAETNGGSPSLSVCGNHGEVTSRRVAGAHVVVSELVVGEDGIVALEAAFRARLGEVDSFPGHLGLQVWRDDRQRGRYVMVTWWETADAFRRYMRSDSHRRSHARIPSQPARPKAVRVDRFSLVTD